ncbi:acyl-CoA synthetase [Taibaiella soli]|uniref:Branched-chain amino acid aminotransferase n=1 Tax=Taibaiella soli TaxID=1649169 RepID=A0A2W2AC18_9BACT|nr:AMP-binding protein [Taibaiella soli]PZF72965.1 branched-chain amino acid aminotransferase [Taibaiella soli]
MSFRESFTAIIEAIEARHYDTLNSFSYEVPEQFNWVRDVFESVHLPKHSGKPMLELVKEDQGTITLTYDDAARRCNQLLNYMRANLVEKGDVVFVMCGLDESLWVSYLSIIKGGFVMIPAAGILSEDDIAYRFEKANPKAIITDKENFPKIEKALAKYGKDVPVKILLDVSHPGWQNISVIDTGSTIAEAADTRADDILFWFFTSGTTGFPKVVAHTHSSYLLGHLSTAAWIGLKPEDKHYNISQPGWAKFAWSCFFAPLNVGATIFCYRQRDRFVASEHLKAIQTHKITTLCAPPTALRLLIQEDLTAYDFSGLRECVSAGEPLNPEVMEAWKSGTGLLLRDGYGQTESTCMVYNLPGDKIKFGSMGRPSFLYDIVIADDEGNEMPLHEEGQIAVRMHEGKFNGIFKEYVGDLAKRAEVFKHGLYYTGDKAYKDEDGYVWFVGRNDDVIKSSDYRVGPFEVESVLLEAGHILESAVVGSPHPIKGYEIKAFVVLKAGVEKTEELAHEIFRYCRQHMAPYKTPRIIEFVDELPKTISGKIKRVELRALEAYKKAAGEHGQHEYHMHK